LVGEEDAGRKLQELGRVLPWYSRQLAHAQVEVGCASTGRSRPTENANLVRPGRHRRRRGVSDGWHRGRLLRSLRPGLRERSFRCWRRRREVKSHTYPTRDGFVTTLRRNERPLTSGGLGRFIEVRPGGVEDLDIRHLTLFIHRHGEVYVDVHLLEKL